MAKKSAKPAFIEPEDESQESGADEPEGRGQGLEVAGRERVSKAEAIRRALAGGMKTPEQGVDFIDRHFGLDVTRQHFSAAKSQMKKKGDAPTGKPGRKPKAESQAVEGYLAPPSRSSPDIGDSDLLAALEAMKPLVAALGADKVKRLADLLG